MKKILCEDTGNMPQLTFNNLLQREHMTGIPKFSVAQLCPDLSGGGGLEKSAVEIAQAVARNGGHSFILSKTIGGYASALSKEGIQFAPFTMSKRLFGLAFYKDVLFLRKFLIQHKIDLLHARSRYPAWVGYFASRGLSTKFITTWHGRHIAKRFSPRWLYNSCLVKADAVIAVSGWVYSEIKRQFPRPKVVNKVVVIERGVDLESLETTKNRCEVLREQWGVPSGRFLILVPGRYTPWKGGLDFIKILDRLRQEVPEGWICVFVGKATKKSYKDKLSESIRASGLEDKVILAEECHDMASAYQLSDLVVLPNTEPEPFGRIAIEAQMAGKAVLASNTGAFSETLFDKNSLITLGDSEHFVSLLKKSVLSQEEDKNLIQHRRNWVINRYNLDKMCKQTLALYGEQMGHSKI